MFIGVCEPQGIAPEACTVAQAHCSRAFRRLASSRRRSGCALHTDAPSTSPGLALYCVRPVFRQLPFVASAAQAGCRLACGSAVQVLVRPFRLVGGVTSSRTVLTSSCRTVGAHRGAWRPSAFALRAARARSVACVPRCASPVTFSRPVLLVPPSLLAALARWSFASCRRFSVVVPSPLPPAALFAPACRSSPWCSSLMRCCFSLRLRPLSALAFFPLFPRSSSPHPPLFSVHLLCHFTAPPLPSLPSTSPSSPPLLPLPPSPTTPPSPHPPSYPPHLPVLSVPSAFLPARRSLRPARSGFRRSGRESL